MTYTTMTHGLLFGESCEAMLGNRTIDDADDSRGPQDDIMTYTTTCTKQLGVHVTIWGS